MNLSENIRALSLLWAMQGAADRQWMSADNDSRIDVLGSGCGDQQWLLKAEKVSPLIPYRIDLGAKAPSNRMV
jgi:hypothetical protein